MFLKRKIKSIDSQKIENAIHDFESAVDFELVPVISERSSFIEHIAWIVTLALVVLFISILDQFLQDSWASRTVLYLVAIVLAVVLGHLANRFDVISRFFISKHERQRQVFEKAQRIFFLKRLNERKSHHALLLYISIMEKGIVILPDPSMKHEDFKGIERKLLVIVQAGFTTGKYEKSFLDAINFLKTELHAKYPQKKAQHENHLSNKLIWWRV